MSIHRFHAVALTPIHIGDGSAWTPEMFKLDGDEIVLFEPATAVAALDKAGHKAFVAAVDAGKLREAQSILHRAVAPNHHLARIAISAASRK